MSAPDKEYNYDHLEQKLYIDDRYHLRFLFYDHPMSGPAMYCIRLVDETTKIANLLRLDSPVEDGTPCFFNDEITAIIKLILNNNRNKLNPTQVLCCLGLIYNFSESLINKITDTLNIKFNLEDKHIWDNLIVEPKTYIPVPYDRCCGPFPADLNEMYPLPRISNQTTFEVKDDLYLYLAQKSHGVNEKLSPVPDSSHGKTYEFIHGIKCEIHPEYGRVIVDKYYCDECSVRSLNSSWNHEQKVAFAEFCKFILSQEE